MREQHIALELDRRIAVPNQGGQQMWKGCTKFVEMQHSVDLLACYDLPQAESCAGDLMRDPRGCPEGCCCLGKQLDLDSMGAGGLGAIPLLAWLHADVLLDPQPRLLRRLSNAAWGWAPQKGWLRLQHRLVMRSNEADASLPAKGQGQPNQGSPLLMLLLRILMNLSTWAGRLAMLESAGWQPGRPAHSI